LTGYLTVLSAQTALLAAERSLLDIDAAATAQRIHLLVAVGGSFIPPRDLPPLATSRVASSSETQP
jgi:outer membrane protein TolC